MDDWIKFKYVIEKIDNTCIRITGYTLREDVHHNKQPYYMVDDPIHINPNNIPVLLKLLDRELKEYTWNGFSVGENGGNWEIGCTVGISDRGWSDLAIRSEMILPDGTKSAKVLHIPYMNISHETVYKFIGPFQEELKRYIL